MTRLALFAVASLSAVAVGVAWADQPNQRLADEARGRELYARHCVSCHGDHAAGDGRATGSLVAPVPDLRGALTEAAMEDQVDVILAGRNAMPGFSLSFDRYDARRVWRQMVRVSADTTPVEPRTPPSDTEPPEDPE